MRKLQATRFEIDEKALRFRTAAPVDYDTLIEESTLVYEGDQLKLVFEVLDKPPRDLLNAFRPVSSQPGSAGGSRSRGLRQSTPSGSGGSRVRGLTHSQGYRTNGLKRSGGGATILGYMARIALRQDYCALAAMARKYPEAHATFVRWAYESAKSFQRWLPEEHAKQVEIVTGAVRPEWRLGESGYTSGIVNSDNPLAYHTDAGNFPGTWNGMYAVAHDCAGGQLSIPQYRLGFSFAKPAFILFEAQNVLHGVTPLKKRSSLAYRYSVVYYALRQLCNCLSPAEEIARIEKVRTVRELKRGGVIERSAKELAQLKRSAEKGRKKAP